MKRIVIIPSDNKIQLDDEILIFKFRINDENIFFIEYSGDEKKGKGYIKYKDKIGFDITEENYSIYIAPYIELFNKEKKRLDELKKKEEEEYLILYNSIESRFERLRNERDKRLKSVDYLVMQDYPLSIDEKEKIFIYRQELRDLPEQPGAPWDGGGPETPWPQRPEN